MNTPLDYLHQGAAKETGPAISYSALVLDPASRAHLVQYWKENLPVKEVGGEWLVNPDHVTLLMAALPAGSDLAALKGTTHAVTADAVGVNPLKTAVALRIRGLVRPDGRQAHVTLAVRGNGRPAESNDITHWEPLKSPIHLRGVIEEVPAANGPEADPAEGVTRLLFLDFDGTLVDTPEPEEGKAAWAQYYGTPYPYEGWWGRPESLDPAIWPMKRVYRGYQVYRRERGNATARLVLLTNRIERLRPQVQLLLDKHGYRLDALTFRQGNETKAARVASWLDALPAVTSVLVLDDHDSYLGPIRELQARYPHVRIETQLVDRTAQHPGAVPKVVQESLERIGKLLKLN